MGEVVDGGLVSSSAPQPVVLTFLAPADQCNQHCPECILDLIGEPVRRFELKPEDYARFVEQFLAQSIPVLSLSFQGYEVTLPRSWPYVESVFEVAKQHELRRSFITNGMLLDRWTTRIDDLQPTRISVSLDGATADSNDPIRGLVGAFDATLKSVRRFLADLPEFAERMTIASCVYPTNFPALRAMPRLMRDLGITRWGLAAGITVRDGIAQPIEHKVRIREQFDELVDIAEREGVRCFVNDEFSLIGKRRSHTGSVRLPHHSLPHEDFFYRVDPAGYVRTGREMLRPWQPFTDTPPGNASEVPWRHWDPSSDDAVDVVDYWSTLRKNRS